MTEFWSMLALTGGVVIFIMTPILFGIAKCWLEEKSK